MDIVVSGIRPTGNLHLGNYFGAVKNFIKDTPSNVHIYNKNAISLLPIIIL